MLATPASTTAPSPGIATTSGRIRIGIGGWTYAPWRHGMFYPEGLVQRRELDYASRQVSAIELNGTYYGMQAPATYARWRDQTPDDFLFSAKAPKYIMASPVLANVGTQVDDFIGGIAELGDKLGPLVWQFEQRIVVDADDFAAFLQLLPTAINGRRLRHVLDVRDPAFVDARYLELARQHGMATVFTDSPDYRSFADITTDFVYARLMRSQAATVTGYEEADLKRWIDRARRWAAGSEPDDLPRIEPGVSPAVKPRDVFVYFISAAKERNPAAAITALQILADAMTVSP